MSYVIQLALGLANLWSSIAIQNDVVATADSLDNDWRIEEVTQLIMRGLHRRVNEALGEHYGSFLASLHEYYPMHLGPGEQFDWRVADRLSSLQVDLEDWRDQRALNAFVTLVENFYTGSPMDIIRPIRDAIVTCEDRPEDSSAAQDLKIAICLATRRRDRARGIDRSAHTVDVLTGEYVEDEPPKHDHEVSAQDEDEAEAGAESGFIGQEELNEHHERFLDRMLGFRQTFADNYRPHRQRHAQDDENTSDAHDENGRIVDDDDDEYEGQWVDVPSPGSNVFRDEDETAASESPVLSEQEKEAMDIFQWYDYENPQDQSQQSSTAQDHDGIEDREPDEKDSEEDEEYKSDLDDTEGSAPPKLPRESCDRARRKRKHSELESNDETTTIEDAIEDDHGSSSKRARIEDDDVDEEGVQDDLYE